MLHLTRSVRLPPPQEASPYHPPPQEASHHPVPLLSPQEASHHHLMRRRALWDSQTPTKLNRHRSLVANSQLSVEEKKQRIVRNLRRLEVLGLVDAAQHYQGLINELAKVCRTTWGSWGGVLGVEGVAFIYSALPHVEGSSLSKSEECGVAESLGLEMTSRVTKANPSPSHHAHVP